jgi:plasmid stabilization system protein ParE
MGLTGGRHRKGAARLLRRARGDDAARKLEGNWAGVFANLVRRKKAGSRAERRRQRKGSTTAAARAALR